MARTVTLTKADIDRIVIDPQSRSIMVEFIVADDANQFRRHVTATFYQTAPLNSDGTPKELEDHEYVLTPQQANTVVNIYSAVKNYIETRFIN